MALGVAFVPRDGIRSGSATGGWLKGRTVLEVCPGAPAASPSVGAPALLSVPPSLSRASLGRELFCSGEIQTRLHVYPGLRGRLRVPSRQTGAAGRRRGSGMGPGAPGWARGTGRGPGRRPWFSGSQWEGAMDAQPSLLRALCPLQAGSCLSTSPEPLPLPCLVGVSTPAFRWGP